MRNKISLNHPRLGLRDNAHEVQVIVPNGSTQPVLGTRHPDSQNIRADTISQGNTARMSPRQQDAATIDLPLPERTQTMLSYRLPAAVQARINGGLPAQSDTRRQNPDEDCTALE